MKTIHRTAPWQWLTTKGVSLRRVCSTNDPTMMPCATADWDLSCVGRYKAKGEEEGEEGGRAQCISSAGPPCSFRVTLHETTEQRGCIQLIKPNKLQVSAERPTQRPTSAAVSDLRDSATIPEQNWARVSGQSTSLTHSPSNFTKHMLDSESSYKALAPLNKS